MNHQSDACRNEQFAVFEDGQMDGRARDGERVLRILQIGHETSLSLVDSLYAAVLQ